MAWIAILLLLMTASGARAEDLPRFNIEAMCRAAPSLGLSEKDTDQSCVRDETEARDQLKQQWGHYNPSQRRMCLEETNVGGSPSYVDVLSCIEMAPNNPTTTATPARRARRQP